MTLDSILKKEALKRIKSDHKENIDILKNTFKFTDAYFNIMEDNVFKLYDKFLELFPLEKDKHGLILTYITSRYYNHVTDLLIKEYANRKQLPEFIISPLFQEDIEYYVKLFVNQDSKKRFKNSF